MKSKWIYIADDDVYEHTKSGVSLEGWQVRSLLDGANEVSFRQYAKKRRMV